MTADSVDLEDCDNLFKGVVGSMFAEDLDVNSFLNPPFRKPAPVPQSVPFISSNSFDSKYCFELPYGMLPFDLNMALPDVMDWEDPLSFDEPFTDYADKRNSDYKIESDLPILGNSSHSDMETELLLVSPNSVLPTPQKDDIDDIAEIWPGIENLSDEKLVKMVDSGFIGDSYVTLDDFLTKKRPRKFTHLDIDHCYSIRPPRDDEEDDDDDYFNSSPYSPASSSCSDNIVENRGVKRTRSKKKNVRRKKIKQEVVTSEDEDVETPCSVPLVVPKITIAISAPPSPPTLPPPAKRGRKPKDKSEGQNVKRPNHKNYPVSPKVLQAAIKQQTKKCYVTKSGRVTKISNSVETTPSTSTPSSLCNSRCNSDNEDSDKRASHNMAERNRRQELTNLFQNLREKVPEIKKNLKASKVAILQGSASHIGDLEEIEKQKLFVKEQLKAEMEKKLALIQSLRNSRSYSS